MPGGRLTPVVTVIGLDDTDSRTAGMCSTYLAALVAEAVVDAGGTVDRLVLVRLNPAVEHKTRGNAALAVHTDLPADGVFDVAADLVEEYAVGDDPHTSPGIVATDADPGSIPDDIVEFARDAVRELHTLDEAIRLAEEAGFRHRGWGANTESGTIGRGRIGALAAVGAWPDMLERTVEHIGYREFDRCGTPRDVNFDSVFEAAEDEYPDAWDTVDRGTREAVCVPNAPGPILHGIRGDDPEAVRRVAERIESEPVERTALFHTNQGTDAHLADAALDDVRDGRGYRVTGEVVEGAETRRGGHVFLTLGAIGSDAAVDSVDDEPAELDCVAFAPTGRFREHVRNLVEGDRITACGEVDRGTLKLEKFAVRSLVGTESVVPTCPDCGRSMESAGAGQGYRCRDCGTTRSGKVERDRSRELERGWYEVPPAARRHIAKPLVRGGFDAPTHPER